MENVQKMMNYLWLLRAEVNSLNEPKILADECISKIGEVENLEFSPAEIEIYKKELEYSATYLTDAVQKLEELVLQINRLSDVWGRG